MNTHVGLRRIKSNALAVLIMALTAINFAIFATTAAKSENGKLHIVAFGDSLTAGYGIPPGTDFASRLETALLKNGHKIRVTNAGVSGDTTSGGLARFEWAVPADTDAVILELGANDALRGISPDIAKSNLDKILARLKKRGVKTLIAGMRAPTNWGDEYAKSFNGMFTRLAAKHDALLYPFFLDGVIDQPHLKLPDALHPNAKGVDEIVRRILPSVEKLIAQIKAK